MESSLVLFADKPAGVTTHSSLNENERRLEFIDKNDGLVEHLSARLDSSLFVVHRLDRETTGAICFARDKETAARLADLFATRAVKKTYLFLTDRTHEKTDFTVESFIERKGATFVSTAPSPAHPPNSRTRIRLLESDHGLSLWEASPETGKPHQIRLHAESVGLSILGDEAHGGSPFPALCLHSHAIEFSLDEHPCRHISEAPIWYHKRELAKDLLLARWLTAIDRRLRLLRSWRALGETDDGEQRTLRWIHSEGDPLRVEQLGTVHWLSWYGDQDPTPKEMASIHQLIALQGWKQWYFQLRGNRGRSPNEETMIFGPEAFDSRWTAPENGVRFEFRTESGLSPGLFLDQRRNRLWAKENSKGRTVLNLFCYTGGFSVCAAVGGAAKTVSVDVSKTFLEWAKANFSHNALSLEGHEFRAIDSREYLAWAAKKGLRFDLVICDPPSFGRSKSGVFKIDKDFPELMASLLALTAENGRILFSSNYEQWSLADFAQRTNKVAKERGLRIRIEATPSPDWDYELPRTDRNMKSFFIVRA